MVSCTEESPSSKGLVIFYGKRGGGHPKIFELKEGGGASQKLKAEEVFYRQMYWFDGALKGKWGGGGEVMQNFQR